MLDDGLAGRHWYQLTGSVEKLVYRGAGDLGFGLGSAESLNSKGEPHLKRSVMQSIRSNYVVLVLALQFLTLPAVVEAQFTYTINNGTVTITGYTGPGGDVAIPATIDGLPETSIVSNQQILSSASRS
jgi:hypothetical protein